MPPGILRIQTSLPLWARRQHLSVHTFDSPDVLCRAAKECCCTINSVGRTCVPGLCVCLPLGSLALPQVRIEHQEAWFRTVSKLRGVAGGSEPRVVDRVHPSMTKTASYYDNLLLMRESKAKFVSYLSIFSE